MTTEPEKIEKQWAVWQGWGKWRLMRVERITPLNVYPNTGAKGAVARRLIKAWLSDEQLALQLVASLDEIERSHVVLKRVASAWREAETRRLIDAAILANEGGV